MTPKSSRVRDIESSNKLFLKRLKEKGKFMPNFHESLNVFQNDASENGLDKSVFNLLVEVLKYSNLGSLNSVLLIKCMIPKKEIDDEIAKKIITWFFTLSIPVNPLNQLLQWFIGCWEYRLINRNLMYVFYDVFFLAMIKQENLENHLAHLIYLMTKPEDVTRRQVTRLLNLNERGKPKKHITALLFLFKSYKPEFVPERILAINIQSVWRPLPEFLQNCFEKVRNRIDVEQTQTIDEFNCDWTACQIGKTKKNQEPLVSSIRYYNIGSSIFNEKIEKSVFDVTNYAELGHYHPIIKLPKKATSLLTNLIGYHLLTFSDLEYQQIFMYNLSCTFLKSFIIENGRYSSEEMNKVLDLTVEFCKYMQHGIPIIDLFINEYMSYDTDKYHDKLLKLMQWSTVSTSELQHYVLNRIKLIFYSSSLNEKLNIIKTLRLLMVNLFVVNHDDFKEKTFPFLGTSFNNKANKNIHIIIQFTKELITSALNIHCYDSTLLSETLLFYEQVVLLESFNKIFISLVPSVVVYGCIVSKSCALLSRMFSLLLNYRECLKDNKDNKSLEAKNRIRGLAMFAEDLVNVLWYDNCFSNRLEKNRKFLKFLSNDAIKSCQINDIDSMLNIQKHCAFFPYIYIINESGLKIKTKNDANNLAAQYYYSVHKFLNALLRN